MMKITVVVTCVLAAISGIDAVYPVSGREYYIKDSGYGCVQNEATVCNKYLAGFYAKLFGAEVMDGVHFTARSEGITQPRSKFLFDDADGDGAFLISLVYRDKRRWWISDWDNAVNNYLEIDDKDPSDTWRIEEHAARDGYYIVANKNCIKQADGTWEGEWPCNIRVTWGWQNYFGTTLFWLDVPKEKYVDYSFKFELAE